MQVRQSPTSETRISNEPLTSTPSNESIIDTSEVPNESSLVTPIVVLEEHEISYYRQSDVEIKNKLCGEIQYVVKQAQLAFKLVDMAFDETISTRNLLIEVTSSIGKLNESLTDLLISCNEELERMPLTSITIEELKSTENFVSRDPSLTKVYNDQELRYLVSQERKNNVDYILNKNLQQQEQQQIEQQKSYQQIIEMLIDCARYLARQCLACCGQEDQDGNFYQLVHLLSRHNSVLEDWIKNINNRPYKVNYMSKDSQNEFIQLLGDCVQHENLCEIKEASYYSIMADSSIDSIRQDMLSIFIRFVNKNDEPEECFVSINNNKT
ncbi:unnamed protein product [Rotaria socialis]